MTALNPSYLTESEWLSCTTPVDMLRFLYGRVPDRKLRLFACALYRDLAGADEDPRGWQAIAVAERYADRQAPLRLLHRAHQEVLEVLQDRPTPALEVAAGATGPLDVARLQELTARVAYIDDPDVHEVARCWLERRRQQCDLLREIVGNLFRPPVIDPTWKLWGNGMVTRIARTIYDEYRFGEIALLKEVLRQAGCLEPAILHHLDNGHHVRGCWLLDRLLDRI
jgi:hypothetical protein